MSLASYEIEGVFQSSVVIPSVEERSPQDERELFKPGLHGCPYCQAHQLSRMGEEYSEIAGWLFDASLRTNLHSEQREEVTRALHRAGLFSDNHLRKDLEVNFRATSKPYGPKKVRKRAGYNHLKGQGHLCAADDEHDVVLSLIRHRLQSDIEKSIPECRIEWQQDKRLDPSMRRPDLQAKIYVDKTFIDHLAVEIQKSSIPIESFRARHLVLSELATKAVWLFRKSGITTRFKDCIEWSLSNGVNIGSYDIDFSGNLIVDQILDQPEASSARQTSSTSSKEANPCNRFEHLEEGKARQGKKRFISLRNEVKGDLSFICSSASRTPIYVLPEVKKDQEEEPELVTFSISLSNLYTGIPPWMHH